MPEEFEVSSPHEQHIEHTTHHAHAQGDRFASKIAVMTAIMATVGALMSCSYAGLACSFRVPRIQRTRET